MKKISVEAKFYLKCDRCSKEFSEPVPHLSIKARSFWGLEKWDKDHYRHLKCDLSFCEPCGDAVWGEFLNLLRDSK